MSTTIILLWAEDSAPLGEPTLILGPFTRAEAEQIAKRTLTCEYVLQTISQDVPEWATS